MLKECFPKNVPGNNSSRLQGCVESILIRIVSLSKAGVIWTCMKTPIAGLYGEDSSPIDSADD